MRTVGFNAFAFSDLHGGGVIGVTEGALARLSRQQLQAVVAHEFAHVLSGGYVTVTVSCLLFGIYSSLVEKLDEAADAGSDTDAASVTLGMVPLRSWLWLMQLASSVVSSALSRERERQADLAAVRYTRDPLALAEALRIIGRHPGGAGYIPEGLAPLCIRATGTLGWPAVSWRDSHPPLEERIGTLLGVAHVSRAEFEGQAERAGEDFVRREHWAPAPMPAPMPADRGGTRGGSRCARAARNAARTAADRRAAARRRPRRRAAVGRCSARRGHGVPRLRRGPRRAPYEGIDIALCDRCGGRLVRPSRSASCWRGGRRPSPRISCGWPDCWRPAATACAAPPSWSAAAPAWPSSRCPRCTATMMRRHYSYEYAVEVDHCRICDLTWFEKDELEALQVAGGAADGLTSGDSRRAVI